MFIFEARLKKSKTGNWNAASLRHTRIWIQFHHLNVKKEHPQTIHFEVWAT